MAGVRKYGYIGVGVIVLLFGVFAYVEISRRIADGEVVAQDRISGPPVEYISLNGERRKVPDFTLRNQDSLLVTEADYRGKVFVVEFFFTTCPTICPTMTRNLVSLQEEFGARQDFGIASITINPNYDTPSRLKQYGEKYGITDLDWNLLTGDREEIYELANAGFNIFAAEMPEVPGGFEHSGLFALIDKEGFIRSRKDAHGNPIVYYRGSIPEDQPTAEEGELQTETQQITILKEDIRKLLKE
ncbi:protein SCO1/2 [Robiginitalea myxolifaciens]|uniref:Protein SCO1/2 n=1 Tax=Robiginitalea myxolifaciens TaxID=400055 RepID=A0A1I6FT33_9FLAO|nr:SCO family protein [Robiginitalea myxolifaciens]SFR33112.1 protein SCO1/2 [Robiginitalea myxolifaciens]